MLIKNWVKPRKSSGVIFLANSVGYHIGFLVPGVTLEKCGFTTLKKMQHKKSIPLRLGTDF